ncbi:hypothetical protein EDC96DRAFT_505305 [Choanephora cucurbitarum]|nr:hypothetical protein EDC96DRAFT_505305 [Choanephora cucurbitarum]
MDNEHWQKILIGKRLIEDGNKNDQETVHVKELPNGYRVLPPGRPQTRDYRPERLNVFVDADNMITQVYFG